ncbi:MAG: oligosaccharide flippase family protein [Flammeovirgaceae bacterium]|nr:oligosaccharide flippase family protein [Flammeovirgaceae bacterium]
MNNKLKNLAGETVLYGLGTIIPRALNFLLFPLHTRIFNPEDYGVVSYLYILVGFLNVVYTFGMETAFFRFSTKEGSDPNRIFNLCQSFIVGISLALSALFIVLAEPLAVALGIAGKSHYIVWLAIIMLIDAVVAIPFARLRLEKKALRFALYKIVNVLVTVGLNIYFFMIAYWLVDFEITFDFKRLAESIQQTNYGIEYVFLANLVANAFYLLFFIKSLIRWRPGYDRATFSELLSYSFPIMLTGLAGMTNELFSRWAIEWWLPENFYDGKSSMYAIGIFSAAYKYAVLMSLGVQAFRFAAEPFFFSNAADKKSPELFAKVNHFFIVSSCIVLLAVSLNMDVLKFIGGEDFYEGLFVVPVLMGGYLFLGIYYNISIWFKLTDKTYFGTIITVAGAILTIGLNYFLIPVFGYVGSSWISLSCYAGMAVACYLIGQRHYPIPYSIRSGLMYIILSAAIILFTQYINFDEYWKNKFIELILLVGFILSAFFIEKNKLLQSA